MKLRNKLLTALLPITATSALVPVLTSCNKGTSWVINYGEAINCLHTSNLEEGEGSYHTREQIASAIKTRVSVESEHTISSVDVLPKWDLDLGKQFLYYDLIASCACLSQEEVFKSPMTFSVIWDLTKASNKIWFCSIPKYGEETWTKVEQIQYTTRSGSNIVYIGIGSLYVKSYAFQKVTIQ